MRWIWIDRFEAFESGVRATAVKNVTLAEDYLHDHFPGFAVMPATLMIEGMAQTAGILVGEARGFREKVILAKIKRAVFDDMVRPGDQLRYDAELESIADAGAVTRGVVSKNGVEMGRVDLMFSHVGSGGMDPPLPEHNFVFGDQFMNLLQTYRTGIDRSGESA
ncbi:MAG: beta-hydroxyacyl-ACP dehydratase [Planctomycetes bacterium]|nr:beta-hydroxyacyl-ACP dehydratase [Planctomycetota bacterium]